jgi:glutamine amidotransferase
MCRLYGFRATESTRVECSLVLAQNAVLAQSREDLRGISNGDGWGIAHYAGDGAIVEKRARAAHEDLAFSALAESLSSSTVIAHVRAATIGGASEANTHPFSHGPWTFAHNGTVTAFESVAPRLASELGSPHRAGRRGDTDSELVFRWLLSRMPAYGMDSELPASDVGTLADLVGDAVVAIADMSLQAGAAEPSKLNLLISDGDRMVVSRWGNSLYWVARRGITDCAVCSLNHAPDATSGYRSVVVASEPLTDENWLEVPEGSLIAIDHDLTVSSRDLLVPARAAG